MDTTLVATSWHAYPSIFNVGHRAIADLLKVPVNVEEKVDGSQFSFGLFPNTDTPTVRLEDGVPLGLRIRSKGASMHPDAPMDMFKLGVAAVKDRIALLHPGWTYRGEFLAKPHHNALAYDRAPNGHFILFDVNTGEESYLSYEDKCLEAGRIGFEVVPRLFAGLVEGIEQFRSFLATPSVLGGQTIEGVVIKPQDYALFGVDKKVLMGKFVSEAFKEVHAKTWKTLPGNTPGKDILAMIGDRYTTAARWQKAIQHMREEGKLLDSPADIGPILNAIWPDVAKECQDAIKEELWKWAVPTLKRLVVRGFPEFYKQRLLEKQFEVSAVENLGFTTDSDPGDETHG